MSDISKNKHLKLILTLFYIALAGVAGYFFFKYLFKWLLPFFIALFVAWILQPAKRFFSEKLHIPKRIAGLILTLLFYGVVGFLIFLILHWAINRFQAFLSVVPDYLSSIPTVLMNIRTEIVELLSKLPDEYVGDILDFINANLPSAISLPSVNVLSVYNTAMDVAFSIPTIIIFIISLLVATTYFINDFDMIIAFIKAQLPDKFNEGAGRLITHLLETLKSWIKAMGIIMLITFIELWVGFLLMGMDYAGVLAAIISVVDALPVLGVGTVLVPWILYMLLVGNFLQALYLAILYIVITTIRNIIEPRIVGVHIGLYPLLTLMCIYFGFRTLGILGMFVIPLFLITLDKLQEWGYIRIWKPVPKVEGEEERKKPEPFKLSDVKKLFGKKKNK